MKKLFSFLITMVLVGSALAQQTVVANPTPDELLLTLKESEFNFGKIPQGKPVMHVFEVLNKSKDSLKIENIVASCGCTTPDWEKDKSVAAGSRTKITVGYNAAAEGPFTKNITISYNGGQTKQIIIKGEVWKTPSSSAPENKSLNDLKN
ncbi:MAG: DUF1573 domain-containing protein [Sphingobacteriales bacterium]|jgi:Protein of unknown function (DUF1573)|nr:DUF1573 domain-containing protein [Sphingobacteriales bacterium]